MMLLQALLRKSKTALPRHTPWTSEMLSRGGAALFASGSEKTPLVIPVELVSDTL